jgi:hypothetical protein
MRLPYKVAVLFHRLVEAGCGPVRKQGDEFRCRCPAHDDHGPSLYVRVNEGKALVHCNADCRLEEICDRLDLAVADLFFDEDDELIDLDCEVQNDGVGTAPPAGAEGPAAIAAPGAELRNAVYTDLLSQLELSTAHFDSLVKRGLPAAEITRLGYKTADSGKVYKAVDNLLAKYGRDTLLQVPGFMGKNDRVVFTAHKGIVIPVRNLQGAITALKVRHDEGHNGPKYTWVSSKNVSCGNVAHVPLGVSAPAATVRLTEGEIKADISFVLSGAPTVSAPGVTNWPLAVPVLKGLGAKKVLLAFDQDGKPGTLAATEKALYGLTREGFEAALESWDGAAAKGVDDLLAGGRQPEVIAGPQAFVRVRDALAGPQEEHQAGPDADPEPEPWPAGVFPPALDAFCQEAAEATGAPPDFVGLAMLVTAGAAVGNSGALRLKPNVWYESPRFYAACVGDPASGKTPAMEVVLKPYQALQMKLLAQYKVDKGTFDKAQAEHEQVARDNRALPENQRRPLPAVPVEPQLPERFLVVEATKESLAPLLEQNPRGLLMPQDEGTSWVRGMNQYRGGRGNDKQFWLSTWSGKAYLVDRKAQGVVPISIPRPFLNVICGLPPDLLNEFADHRGRNDGFLDRVLFVFPRSSPGAYWTEATVSEAAEGAWGTTLAGLRKLAMQPMDDGTPGYQAVNLSPAARGAWVSWHDAHVDEMRSAELPAQLIGPWAKLRSYLARIALVLHFAWLLQTDGDEGDLQAATVERAVKLINYFKSHLRLVYARLRQTPEDSELLEALDWARKHGGRCTALQLLRARKAANAEKARKLLKELAERGYGRIDSLGAKNNKKVEWFVFDPVSA